MSESKYQNHVILCYFCKTVNPSFAVKCKTCGRNLSGKVDVIDRRTKDDEIKFRTRRTNPNRRMFKRLSVDSFPIYFGTTANIEKTKMLGEGISSIVNISEVGIYINTDSPKPVGTKLLLRFKLLNENYEFNLIGKVIRSVDAKDKPFPHGMALLFVSLTADEKIRLRESCGQLQK